MELEDVPTNQLEEVDDSRHLDPEAAEEVEDAASPEATKEVNGSSDVGLVPEVKDTTQSEETTNIVPEATEEEKLAVKKEIEEKAEQSEFPKFYEHPLADLVEEMGLMAGVAEDPEFYADLEQKAVSFYQGMKNTPDAVAKKYYPDMCRRFIECERRIKKMEDMLWALPREDRSIEEDRFEILTELLDKAAQGLDIWDEHQLKELHWGHRLVLEGRLVGLIDSKFDIIENICKEFDKLKGDQEGANNEREWLRYEIRHCDLNFYDINEAFLKSYLDMDW